jgi:hypothetical protein
VDTVLAIVFCGFIVFLFTIAACASVTVITGEGSVDTVTIKQKDKEKPRGD